MNRVLGETVRHPVDRLDTFPAPEHVETVTFRCAEVASMCPVTEQPDLSTVTIVYQPAGRCVESKSLKLFLWGFRDRGVFVEQLAADIAERVWVDAEPVWVEVEVSQAIRGGIVTTAQAHREEP